MVNKAGAYELNWIKTAGLFVFFFLCSVPALEMNGFSLGIPISLQTGVICATLGGLIGGAMVCSRPLYAGIIGGVLAGPAGLLAVYFYTQSRVEVWALEVALVQIIASLPGFLIGKYLHGLGAQKQNQAPQANWAASPTNLTRGIRLSESLDYAAGKKKPNAAWYLFGFCFLGLVVLYFLELIDLHRNTPPLSGETDASPHRDFLVRAMTLTGIACAIAWVIAWTKFLERRLGKAKSTASLPCEWLVCNEALYIATASGLVRRSWQGVTFSVRDAHVIFAFPQGETLGFTRGFCCDDADWRRLQEFADSDGLSSEGCDNSARNDVGVAITNDAPLDRWQKADLSSEPWATGVGSITQREWKEIPRNSDGALRRRAVFFSMLVAPICIGFALRLLPYPAIRGLGSGIGYTSLFLLGLIFLHVIERRRRETRIFQEGANQEWLLRVDSIELRGRQGSTFYLWTSMKRHLLTEQYAVLQVDNTQVSIVLVSRAFSPEAWSRIKSRVQALPAAPATIFAG